MTTSTSRYRSGPAPTKKAAPRANKSMPTPQERDFLVQEAKQERKDLDGVLQRMKAEVEALKASPDACENHGEAIANQILSVRDTESAIMRLGMVLKNVGNPNPYPQSYNPESKVVEPTADGLKL